MSTSNPFARLQRMLPGAPLLVGTVVGVGSQSCTIELPDGAQIQARGGGTISTKVFVRNGLIEGPAPDLTTVSVEE